MTGSGHAPLTAERAAWLLAHPLDYADGSVSIDPYRAVHPQPGGALLTAILAVDR